MELRPAWTEGVDEPAVAVLGAINLSKMARRAEHITEEVTRIKQRVDRMIQTFERVQGLQAHEHTPDMEILEDVDDLQNILTDQLQKKRYQQKLTVFIVGYQEVCGQRSHLLAQLQEFFSIYSKLSEEDGDLTQLEDSPVDLDGVADQVTGALRSAEAAMSRLVDIHTGIVGCIHQTLSAGSPRKRKISDDKSRKKLEKAVNQAKEDIVKLTDQLLHAQEDLTSKDKQVKELLKQNEVRMLEVHHFKGQLESTKRSLQTLQEESGKQCSLLEAELRTQAGRLVELEIHSTTKRSQQMDVSTQWETQNSLLSEYEEAAATIPDEPEKGEIQKAEKYLLTLHEELLGSVDKESEVQKYTTELSLTDVSIPLILADPELEESIYTTTSLPKFEENNSVTKSHVSEAMTSLSLREENVFASLMSEQSHTNFASLPESENRKSFIDSQIESEENISIITSLPVFNETIHCDTSLPLLEGSYSSSSQNIVSGERLDSTEQTHMQVSHICNVASLPAPGDISSIITSSTVSEEISGSNPPLTVCQVETESTIMHPLTDKIDDAAESYTAQTNHCTPSHSLPEQTSDIMSLDEKRFDSTTLCVPDKGTSDAASNIVLNDPTYSITSLPAPNKNVHTLLVSEMTSNPIVSGVLPDRSIHASILIPVPDMKPHHITSLSIADQSDFHVASLPVLERHGKTLHVKEKSINPNILLHLPENNIHTDISLHVPEKNIHTDISLQEPENNIHTELSLHVPEKNIHTDISLCVPEKNIHTDISLHVPEKNIHTDISLHVPEKNIHTDISLHVPEKNIHTDISLQEPENNIHTEISLHVPEKNIHSELSLHLPEKNIHTDISLHVPEKNIHPKISLITQHNLYLHVPEIHHASSLFVSSESAYPNIIPSFLEYNILPNEALQGGTVCTEPEDPATKTHTEAFTQTSNPEVIEQQTVPTDWMLHSEGEQHILSTVNSDTEGEIQEISQRLQMCIQAIRNLLITGGFPSLANSLRTEDPSQSGDDIARNITLVENVPAVLHSLIERLFSSGNKEKQSTFASSQDDLSTTEIIRPKDARITHLDADNGKKICRCTQHLGQGHLHIGSEELKWYRLIFTRQDEDHNRRVLQRAARQGRIPLHKYQDTSQAMAEYRKLLLVRLQSLVRGYRLSVSWNQAESLLRRQSHQYPQVLPILTKLQEMKKQALIRWKEDRVRSWEKRLHLSVSLDQTLREVQEESGIFLIKPVLSWPGRSQLLETRRPIHSKYKAIPKTGRLPSYYSKDQVQDRLWCCGRAPAPLITQEWSVQQNHEVLKPLVIIPKMQEMDVRGYLFKECRVMSQPRDVSPGSASPLPTSPAVSRTPSFPAL